MTDQSSAVEFADIEGKPVVGSTIKITNAGDGLSAAMEVDPIELHQGEQVYVVLECEVSKLTFEAEDKEDLGGPQIRVQVLKAGTATIVDADLVKSHLDEQAGRIEVARQAAQLAKEEAAGVHRLPMTEDDDFDETAAAAQDAAI